MLLYEANYAEFRKRYQKGMPFALISAFQGDFDVSKNRKNNIALRNHIKAQGYDCIKITGRYMEDDNTYELMVVYCNDEKNYSEFLRFLLYFAKHYRQNSIIVVDSDCTIWQYATKTGSTIGGMGSKRRYDKFMNMSPSEFDSLVNMMAYRSYQTDTIRTVTD